MRRLLVGVSIVLAGMAVTLAVLGVERWWLALLAAVALFLAVDAQRWTDAHRRHPRDRA